MTDPRFAPTFSSALPPVIAPASAVVLPAVERIRRVEAEVGRYIIGRGDEIHGLLLALIARQHVFLLSPPGAGKCLPGDTRVYDPDTGQLVRLDSIVERVEAGGLVTVASLDDEMRLVSARVTDSARNGVRPIFRLRTRLGRQIRATANHPFRTWDGWTALEHLRVGDQIAVPRMLPLSGTRDSMSTDEAGLARLGKVASSDVWWDEIVSIEPDGTAETFDIEVEGFANFVADDIIVHNSLMASEIARRIRGARFFRIDLHPFTMREELFGPISLSAMRERDALERRWEGYLPGATLAQLDEIWRCPPSTLNTLLSLLNEREFRQDETVLRSPLVSAVSTANDLPPADRSLDALYDRILLRYQVAPLTATDDRRRASAFSLRMRALETTARRAAGEITVRRDDTYVRARGALSDASTGAIATLDADYTGNALALERPDRWLIDRYGELLATPDSRAAVIAGSVALPPEADRRDLLARVARWIDEEGGGGELPYRTFLGVEDLDTLAALALSVRLPDPVDEAFYRIIEQAGAVSVRRETELRTLVAAEAVLAGRTVAAVRDLRVATHTLWDRPDTRAEVRRLVEAETGNMDEELAALSATLDEWADLTASDIGIAESLSLRDQMDLELARFARLSEAYGDRPDVRRLLLEARTVRDRYEASIFAGSVDDGATH